MLNTILNNEINIINISICLITSLILGILTAVVFSYKNKVSKTLSFALALLPMAMCMIVMMINGNLGIAVSVAGSFTLVRFRSIAGNGKDIVAIFIVMVIGTILGMGYVGIAILFFVVMSISIVLLTSVNFGENRNEKLLKITIPEDYDYSDLFDDIFNKYDVKYEIEKIKTTNLGSLIDITYRIEFKEKYLSKNMLDDIRCRNANLPVMLFPLTNNYEQL